MDFPRICPARWLTDQPLGMCMPPHDFLYPFYDTPSSYLRPWKWHNQNISKELSSTIECEKGNYRISLDVQHFLPNDISVKVTDCEIIVEGKHEERQDSHGFISRQFKRRYALPKDCPAENVTSTMSSDGILIIIAEKISSNISEKIVPIKMCGISPRKTQIESKVISEITEKSVKENIMDTTRNDFASKNTQIMLKEDHSRLLKPELFKETMLDSNVEKMTSKQEINTVVSTEKEGMAEKKEGLTEKKEENTEKKEEITEKREGITEKMDAINIGATSSKIDESMAKFTLGLSELKDQLGQKNIASTSEMCGIKGMSQTRIEESSSSYMSSSSMSSTMKGSGKIGECVSDIISAELREAAENV